jgi:UDP-N-acetylmuramoyl-tripeptide--D-alanyl-D-alanine ligase
MKQDLLEKLYQSFLRSTGVTTDTRSIKPGQVFFCLRGPNFDANTFAVKALELGAVMVVSDDATYQSIEGILLVDDVLQALQDLARHHRRHFNIPYLAITGSNGKTTTKELVREALSPKFKVWATQGNLNNHIGVPLTLLAMPADTNLAVIEMGANHQGEIRDLCAIAEPTHGLITNIGKAHLEGFGGVDGILKGKTELFDFLAKNDGLIFLNSSDKALNPLIPKYRKLFTFPNEGDDFYCQMLEANPFVQLKTQNGLEVKTALVGSYNFLNAAAALAVANFFGVPEPAALEAIAAYRPENNRSQLIPKGDSLLILDAYNANPSSMHAAIENLASMQGYEQKMAILGDMLELGDESDAEHQKLAGLVRALRIDKVVFCGPEMKAAARQYAEAEYFEQKTELAEWLKNKEFSKTLVLIKGSRGMGLETLKDSLNLI